MKTRELYGREKELRTTSWWEVSRLLTRFDIIFRREEKQESETIVNKSTFFFLHEKKRAKKRELNIIKEDGVGSIIGGAPPIQVVLNTCCVSLPATKLRNGTHSIDSIRQQQQQQHCLLYTDICVSLQCSLFHLFYPKGPTNKKKISA